MVALKSFFGFLFVSLLTPSAARAVEGVFTYQGEVSFFQAFSHQVISTQDPQMTAKVQELQAQAYECQRQFQVWRCRKSLNKTEVSLEKSVKPNQQELRFSPILGEQVIVDSEMVEQREVQQSIEVGGQEYKAALYTLMKPRDLLKISVPDSHGPHHFIAHSSGRLSELQTYRIQKSRQHWLDITLEVFFNKMNDE